MPSKFPRHKSKPWKWLGAQCGLFHNFSCKKAVNRGVHRWTTPGPANRMRVISVLCGCDSDEGLESLPRVGGSMSESSDRELLDLIRRRGPLTVGGDGREPGGDRRRRSATGWRGCSARGWSSGATEHGGRGRPRHAYQASVEAHKRLGQNYADLAVVLWEEMMSTVEDRKLRRVSVHPDHRSAGRAVSRPGDAARSGKGRLVQLTDLLHDRGVEAEVARDGGGTIPDPPAAFLPLLRAGRGRPRRLRPGAQDVREGAGPRPAAQPVPARRRPLLRLPGQAGPDLRPSRLAPAERAERRPVDRQSSSR